MLGFKDKRKNENVKCRFHPIFNVKTPHFCQIFTKFARVSHVYEIIKCGKFGLRWFIFTCMLSDKACNTIA